MAMGTMIESAALLSSFVCKPLQQTLQTVRSTPIVRMSETYSFMFLIGPLCCKEHLFCTRVLLVVRTAQPQPGCE